MAPLFTAEGWAQHQRDSMYALKAGYCTRPEHWAIRLPQLCLAGQKYVRPDAGDDPTAPQILIHKADQWAVVYTDGKSKPYEGELSVRGLRQQMDDWTSTDQIHGSPVAVDGEITFACLKKRVRFDGGHGIRMVCQWTIEPDLVRRGELHYMFLGMSDDDSCQIVATFQLDVPELSPPGDKSSHLGWSTDRYDELSLGMKRYEAEAKVWLEKHAEDFTPKLPALDAMMQSLHAAHWS
jgi:hypothetical protein